MEERRKNRTISVVEAYEEHRDREFQRSWYIKAWIVWAIGIYLLVTL